MKLEWVSLLEGTMKAFKTLKKACMTAPILAFTDYTKPFLLTDNNPLTYIMMMPNLDATGHQWVRALTRFNFQLEYQKGCDNTVVDVLSWVTTCLNPDMVRSSPNGVTLGAAHWVEVHDPTVIKGDHGLEQEVCVAMVHVLVQMHITDWA